MLLISAAFIYHGIIYALIIMPLAIFFIKYIVSHNINTQEQVKKNIQKYATRPHKHPLWKYIRTYKKFQYNTLYAAYICMLCGFYFIGSQQHTPLSDNPYIIQDTLSDGQGHSIELNGVAHIGNPHFYANLDQHIINTYSNQPHTHIFVEGVKSDKDDEEQYPHSAKTIQFLQEHDIPTLCKENAREAEDSMPLYGIMSHLLNITIQNNCFTYYALRDNIPVYDVDANISNTKQQDPANKAIQNADSIISDQKLAPFNNWMNRHPYLTHGIAYIIHDAINITIGVQTIIQKPTDTILPNNTNNNEDPSDKYILHYRNTLLCNGMDKYPADQIIVVYGKAHLPDIEQQWIARHPNWHITSKSHYM